MFGYGWLLWLCFNLINPGHCPLAWRPFLSWCWKKASSAVPTRAKSQKHLPHFHVSTALEILITGMVSQEFFCGCVSRRWRMSSLDQKIYAKVWKIYYTRIQTPLMGTGAQEWAAPLMPVVQECIYLLQGCSVSTRAVIRLIPSLLLPSNRPELSLFLRVRIPCCCRPSLDFPCLLLCSKSILLFLLIWFLWLNLLKLLCLTCLCSTCFCFLLDPCPTCRHFKLTISIWPVSHLQPKHHTDNLYSTQGKTKLCTSLVGHQCWASECGRGRLCFGILSNSSQAWSGYKFHS